MQFTILYHGINPVKSILKNLYFVNNLHRKQQIYNVNSALIYQCGSGIIKARRRMTSVSVSPSRFSASEFKRFCAAGATEGRFL